MHQKGKIFIFKKCFVKPPKKTLKNKINYYSMQKVKIN